ncbi:MAG: D-aminoacylase [Pseudomonadota bacterium]
MRRFLGIILCGFLAACSQPDHYDVILRGGTVVDGTGSPAFVADIGLTGDRIAAIGDLAEAEAALDLDVTGLTVAPGFTNMLSWASISLIEDGRSQSDIRQGVTLEVMGEGSSMGPLNEAMKTRMRETQGDIKFDVAWNTLGEYLNHLESRGVSTNVASFIGAATPRKFVIGYDDRAASADEIEAMQALVREAMEEGAMGVASSLIYPPGSFADTDELIALARAAAEYDGVYASHIRDEGSGLIEAIDELITIAREADIRAEIYHLKSSGEANWPLFDQAIANVEAAKAEGLEIFADVYTYPASATGLNAAVPPWVQEGGFDESVRRMKDPAIRKKLIEEMNDTDSDWDNMYEQVGGPDNILLVGFRTAMLKPLTGKTLTQVAEQRGTSPEETIFDLIIEDNSRIDTVYFGQSPDIVRQASLLPWVSFNSDEASLAPEGVFLESSAHPRAYGSFARVLGTYVRDEGVLSIEEAVRKLAALPVDVLSIQDRGRLLEGHFADVVVFDATRITDHATFAAPHQYATGMLHVFVNGEQVLKDGDHTGATPGRFVRGPGWIGTD